MQDVPWVKVVSLHHDLSTATGEIVVLSTLAGPPVFREKKRGNLRTAACLTAADVTGRDP